MFCRMTAINCPYANENGFCGSTVCLKVRNTKERSENIRNSSIWVKPQSNWHTGTPTEIEEDEIWQWNYALVLHTEYDCIGNYLAGLLFRPNFEKGFFENGNIKIPFSEVVAWQRLEPFKEENNETNTTD